MELHLEFWKEISQCLLGAQFLVILQGAELPISGRKCGDEGYGALGLEGAVMGRVFFSSLIELCLGVHNLALPGFLLLLCKEQFPLPVIAVIQSPVVICCTGVPAAVLLTLVTPPDVSVVLQDVLAELLGVTEEVTAIHQRADTALICPEGVATHIGVLKHPLTPLNTHD